jgi:cation:H+ antiporter
MGTVRVNSDYHRRDVLIALIAGLLPILLALDGVVSRVDGLILLAIYGAYAKSFFKHQYQQIADEQNEESFTINFLRVFKDVKNEVTRVYGKFFVGIALMLFSADIIVKIATFLAKSIGMPKFVVGLIIVAIGTSLPELAFSLRSLRKHENSMFLGNLLGSTIANSTLIVGVASVIHPITLVAFNNYLIAAVTFAIVFLMFWLFVRTKHRLDRWEAVILILLFLVFVAIELLL